MKTFKIILGILLLYGAGTEYISASNQLSTFFSPGILMGCLIMILVSAWLMGSGISKQNFEIRSVEFLKYMIVAASGFVVFALAGLKSYKPEPDIITSNGVKVDISKFMNGSKNIIPDEKERRIYCTCVVDKLTKDSKITNRFSDQLMKGDIDKIITALNTTPDFYELKMNECMSSVKSFHWTEAVEKSLRENIYNQVKDTELSKTNNIDTYCDCLVTAYKKLALSQISDSEFYLSEVGLRIDSLCNTQSKLR